jgi:hypothetical protein
MLKEIAKERGIELIDCENNDKYSCWGKDLFFV